MFENFEIDKGILDLQEKIGLPENFFKELLKEDDWSFVIKLHALIEGVCTSLLVFHFNDPKLQGIFSQLELSNTTTGKLTFLKETELLGTENRRYISSLSQLRNKLVHDIKHYKIDLKKMISDFDKNQKKNFAISFSPLETIMRKFQELPFSKKEENKNLKNQSDVNNLINRAISDPKFHIWLGAYHVLVSIVDMHGFSDYIQAERAEEILYGNREIL